MAITINAAMQNVGGDAMATVLEGETVNLYGGTPPADAKAAQSNDVIATGTAPSFDPHSGDSGAAAASSFTVTGTTEAGAGTNATHFRVVVAGTGEIMQGTVSGSGGGGDMQVQNVNIADDQVVTVTSFVIRMPDGSA